MPKRVIVFAPRPSTRNEMEDPVLRPRFSQLALVALFLLSSIACSHGQVYTCPITRVPGDADRGDDVPMPLPTRDPGFSSAEFGTLDHPFTTSAAYGAQYNTGTSNVVETSAPTKNMPYVWLHLLIPPCDTSPSLPLTWWRLA